MIRFRLNSLKLLLSFICSLTFVLAIAPSGHARTKEAAPPPSLFVHYMPWYEARPISPQWGWHWTMNHYDPETRLPGDRCSIASHYYPLIGPYDSSDPHVLEYHALLMKFAGIDGVIIDWYGATDFRDYGIIHRNTLRLIEALKRFGLKFAVCYEDQSLKHMVENGFIQRSQALEQGRRHLRWLKEQGFKEPLYVKREGKPLLLVFGPQHFSSEEWKELFSSVQVEPSFFTLDHLSPPAEGIFGWPPMWMSKGKRLTFSQVEEYLKGFYARPEPTIGIAFPGFHDIYGEAGVQPSYGYLDAEGGKTLTRTLQMAMEAKSPIIQIATWNDFGEGTTIEPTREYGYRYLEIVRKNQADRKSAGRKAMAGRELHLRLPLRLYQLRKQAETGEPQKALDAVADLLKAGKFEAAEKRLEALESKQHRSSP